jgi:hypothetical protein
VTSTMFMDIDGSFSEDIPDEIREMYESLPDHAEPLEEADLDSISRERDGRLALLQYREEEPDADHSPQNLERVIFGKLVDGELRPDATWQFLYENDEMVAASVRPPIMTSAGSQWEENFPESLDRGYDLPEGFGSTDHGFNYEVAPIDGLVEESLAVSYMEDRFTAAFLQEAAKYAGEVRDQIQQ